MFRRARAREYTHTPTGAHPKQKKGSFARAHEDAYIHACCLSLHALVLSSVLADRLVLSPLLATPCFQHQLCTCIFAWCACEVALLARLLCHACACVYTPCTRSSLRIIFIRTCAGPCPNTSPHTSLLISIFLTSHCKAFSGFLAQAGSSRQFHGHQPGLRIPAPGPSRP